MVVTIKTTSKDFVQVRGTWIFIWTDEDGNEIKRREDRNLVVSSGIYALAAMIIGELPQTCSVWVALGTGTTAPVTTNTKLESESVRKAVTTKTRNNGEIIYRFYFLTGEAVGDFTEWGVFLEGTSMAGSGRLLNRLVPAGGVSKDSNENLTVEVRIALAAA